MLMSVALHMGFSFFRAHSYAPAWGPQWAADWVSAPVQSFPWAAVESLLHPLEHFLPSFFSLLGVLRTVAHIFPSVLTAVWCFALKYIFTEAPTSWVPWSLLEPAVSCCQHLDTYTKCTLYHINPYLLKFYYAVC